MKRGIYTILALLLLTTATRVEATHIAGAELTYECLGQNQYRIKLTFFRDCLNGSVNAPFDDPLELFVFESAQSTLYNTWSINAPFSTPQVPINWDACVATLPNFCVEEGIYETVITLPPVAGGYDIGWTRCCRNNVITNLSAPQCEGVTFLAHVPGPAEAVCNSMPTFNQRPSIFLCAGETYYFDNSATDIDGDSLAYEISNPFTGINFQGLGTANSSGQCGPGLPDPVASQFNPMGPPPYQNVVFSPGHSFLNPFGPGSYISINPGTGYLEALPANPGIYVVAISVKEYRNGILLSENKRDFQFYVIPCLPQDPPPVLTHDLTGLNANGDTIFAEAGKPFCYDFMIEDTVLPSTLVVTPISTAFGGNGGFPPPYATITTNGTTAPVEGQICWTPGCSYVGDAVPMIISARDTNDCPNYNVVFDTIWVVVVPSPGAPPLVQSDISQLPTTNGDTIIVDIGEQFCYDFIVVDTLGGGSLTAGFWVPSTAHVPIGPTLTYFSNIPGDTIFGTVCWEGVCDSLGLFWISAFGTDEYQCPPENEAQDTVWIRVRQPENPAPVLTTDISQNPTIVADTIIAEVFGNFCFNFEVVDTALNSGDSLGFLYYLTDLQGNIAPGISPSYSVSGIPDSIGGEICWTPVCVNVDQVYRFLVQGIQVNDCSNRAYDYDTVYVRVIEPFKPAPIISHDLGPAFPDNMTVVVEDADTFCFTFSLFDPVTPTQLSYSMEVFYANGDPFNGALPSINYNQFLDSLVTGEICWTVPCELAGESFKIRMIGRDTFDCRVSNIVYDSIFVQHTENDPAEINFCRVSVMQGDASIEMIWEPGFDEDGAGYVLYRRRSDETSFSVLDTLYGYADSSFVDASFVNADDYSYCYQVRAIDRCGNLSEPSGEMCTILLDGMAADYTSELTWSPYVGWPFGVDQYTVFREDPTNSVPGDFLIDLGPNAYFYTDRTITAARTCYRIVAREFSGSCGRESWSNEICVNFPPTLYVPTAFSPNGDGLNDIFTSAGEFVQDFDLRIYDRWGKLLFQTTDVTNGWDGTVNGKPTPEGVYIFRMMVVGYDGQVLQRDGSVTLIR